MNCATLTLTAQMLNAIVTVLGPETQADHATRTLILRLCDELQRHPGAFSPLPSLHPPICRHSLYRCIPKTFADANVQLAGLRAMEQVSSTCLDALCSSR